MPIQRQRTLNLPCRETTAEECFATKRNQANWNDGYLLKDSVELARDRPGSGNVPNDAKGPDWCTIMSL